MNNTGTVDIEQFQQELRNELAELDKRANRENVRVEAHRDLARSLELLNDLYSNINRQVSGDCAKEMQDRIDAITSEVMSGTDVCEQYNKEIQMLTDKKTRIESDLSVVKAENERLKQLFNRVMETSSNLDADKENETLATIANANQYE